MTAAELENLIASGGRLVSLPGGTHYLDRPALVSRNDVTIDGLGAGLSCSENHDALVVCPPQLLAPAGCWSPDPATGHMSFRTFGYAALSFRNTPLDLGPAVNPGVGYYLARGYGNARRLQVDLWVRRNGPDWTGDATIAGMIGPETGVPGPWLIQTFAGSLRLLWAASDGSTRAAAAPLPAGNPPELQLTFALDLDAGTWSATANGTVSTGTLPPGLALDNDRLAGGLIGVADAGGNPGTGPDLTYLGFRVSLGLPGLPAPGDWFAPRPDTLFLLTMDPPEGAAFCRWRSGAAGSGHPSYANAAGYGLGIVRPSGEPRCSGVSVRDLRVSLPGSALFGAAVRAFPMIDFAVRDLVTEAGACGIALPYGHTNSYPVLIERLTAQFHGLAGVWVDRAVLRGRDLTIKYCRRNAAYLRDGSARLDGGFYAASQDFAGEPIQDVLRFDRCDVVDVRGFDPDFEGSAPRRSYYRLTPSPQAPTRAALTFCTAGLAAGSAGPVPAVLLAGPPAASPARCTLTETPTVYAGPSVASAAGWE